MNRLDYTGAPERSVVWADRAVVIACCMVIVAVITGVLQ